uniref:Uncharacterized protein n=1 Tax=Triticum urartu TaxID=4572 RepID=A0A8R7P334_TRIUA
HLSVSLATASSTSTPSNRSMTPGAFFLNSGKTPANSRDWDECEGEFYEEVEPCDYKTE